MDTLKLHVIDTETKNMYLTSNQYTSDIGFDIFTPHSYACQPMAKTTLHLGIICQLVDSTGDDLAYMLVPRSSLHKWNVMMSNSVGIIDPGYRGEISAVVYNHTSDVQYISKYDRLFQLVPFSGRKMKLDMDAAIDYNTERGQNGFGSTGK